MLDTTNNCVFELTTIDNPDKIDLTRREKQVMRYLAKGYKVPKIANEMGISPPTVGYYKRRVMCKTECSSITSAMALVVSLGLLEE